MSLPKKSPKKSAGAVFPSSKDLELLKEMGFRKTLAHERKMDLLNNKLRMRQLDQLKMMFFRMNFMQSELFQQDLKKRILRNDMSAYSEAIDILFANIPAARKKKEKSLS